MKIDRHNYEEFFILYWDNELTAVQRQAVEDFINQNIDLREEFELLGETRFTPDAEINFKEKEFLLNNSLINITNYEEQLINYIDDEVSDDERLQIEKFARLNPVAQKELELLQKTKLQPEAISFPGKSVLYRKEEKPVRIISMTWFRVAVAAAIIVIAGFTALRLSNTGKNDELPTTEGPSLAKNIKKNELKDQDKVGKDNSTEQATKDEQRNIAKNINDKVIDQSKREGIKKEEQKKFDETATASVKEPENKNNLPKPRNNFNNDQQSTSGDGAVAKNDLPLLKRDFDAVEKKQSGDAIFTSSTVTNKPELTLYIPEAEAKEKDGGGIKEFLRKTTRVFERRTKIQTTTDDNKLLVGAFAVSLK